MSIYDTYGVKEFSLDEVQKQLEKLLEIKFELRYSSYKGDYCLFRRNNKEKYEIVNNYTEEEGWVLDERKDISVILDVSNAPQPNELRKLLLSKINNALFIERIVITENSEGKWKETYHYIDGKDILIQQRKTIR